MELPENSQLLRIFVGEADKYEGKALYEAVVELARSCGLAGATVLRGQMSFGASSRIHTAKILRLSEDLPVIIEIVDAPEQIETFLPKLKAITKRGLITLENIKVIAYGHNL